MAKNFDERFKALAHPLRRALLTEMSDSGRNLSFLVDKTGAPPSLISNHLRMLEQAQIIKTRPRGRGRVYQLRKEGLQPVLAFLRSLLGEV
jgi:DNA-binding transcriptional ArsR family regulator